MIFRDKTVLISGASRGIGKAIALKLASAGANIIIASKSVTEDARLGGTIYETADAVEKAGGRGLACICDVRNESMIQKTVAEGVAQFGGIDIVINNASAIGLLSTEKLEPKLYDLMFDINVRGSFMMVKYSLPYLKKGSNPHILTLSPPINLDGKWLGPHGAYTATKYSMSLLTLGWAEEFKPFGIAANALWPVTTIATAAVQNLLGGDIVMKRSRKPGIVADAAFHLLSLDAKTHTGNLWLDEAVLKDAGITSFDQYAVQPGMELHQDLFL
jgi:citronellol/citronellal dehydrogenase